jgi:hypothetical protein
VRFRNGGIGQGRGNRHDFVYIETRRVR